MAEMFPTVPGRIPVQAAEEIGRVPAFDSGTSRFLLVDGALVERTGREAVRQWFDLMLRQQPNRVPIYMTEAGAAGIGVDRQMRRRSSAMCGRRLPIARRCGRYGILR